MNFLEVHKKLLIKVVNASIWGRGGGGRDGTSAGSNGGCVRLQFQPLWKVRGERGIQGSSSRGYCEAVGCAGWFNKPFT